MKKYELTEETKTLADGTVLHRIRALMDISRYAVKSGDLGGWIEKENNLSQDGDAFVCGDALVYGNAFVSGDALLYGYAKVYGNACVSGDALVSGNAEVYCDAKVYGNAWVSGGAFVSGNAEVYCDAFVSGNAKVSGDAFVSGNACVCDNAEVCGDAKVKAPYDYAVYKNIWSSGRWFTYTRSNKKWKVGCFYGTGEELIAKAYKDSKLSGKCYEAIVHAVKTIEAAKAEAKGETK